jgi:hypothetical protein
MNTFIGLIVTHNTEIVAESINKLLQSPVKSTIFVYDATPKGMHTELQRFIKSYNRYGVFLKKINTPDKYSTQNGRYNLAVGEALRLFQMSGKRFDKILVLDQAIQFSNFDLQIFADNVLLYNSISPVVESINGIEIVDAVFDRYGTEYYIPDDATLFITGKVEESCALNPKVFGLSKRYAMKLKDFTYSNRESSEYVNELLYSWTPKKPYLDSRTMVHEQIYY